MAQKSKNKGKSKVAEIPDHLKDFIETILIKEDFDDPKERARRAAQKRREKEEAAKKLMAASKLSNKFTEEDIKILVKQFKMDFPTGKVTKEKSLAIVRKVFPRFDADCVMKNIYETFDSANTGRVSQNEILWVFSMAMNGTVDEKLAWLFKLYDKDSNGEIVQEEMEDIFLKLCRIVEKTEVDHFKKHAKLAEEERKKKALQLEKQREREMKKAREDMYEEKNKVAKMYSEKKKRLEGAKQRLTNPPKKKKRRKPVKVIASTVENEDESDEDKVYVLKSIADELCQPQRDCKKFDPVKRAKEIFTALDLNGDGAITEDEFVGGCKSDGSFLKVMDDLCLDFLWSANP